MSIYCRDVQLFQNKFGFPVPSDFTFITEDMFDFRKNFLYEELNEMKDAFSDQDLGEVFDALIDLVYISCGTLIYHGIGYDKLDDELISKAINGAYIIHMDTIPSGTPGFLSESLFENYTHCLEENIREYIEGYGEKNKVKTINALVSIYYNCLAIANQMDLTTDQWNILWDDVQTANMNKERVVSVEQSKRGSTYDIIKPKGWVPPKTKELVNSFL